MKGVRTLLHLLFVGGCTAFSVSRFEAVRSDRGTALGPTARNGLGYEDITIGQGRRVLPGDTVALYYTGSFQKGSGPFAKPFVFDQTVEEEPFQFNVGKGELILGCDLGILGDISLEIPPMNIGGERRLQIPAGLAYGSEGAGPIPPDQDLDFRIQVIDAFQTSDISLEYRLKAYAGVLTFVVVVLSTAFFVLNNM